MPNQRENNLIASYKKLCNCALEADHLSFCGTQLRKGPHLTFQQQLGWGIRLDTAGLKVG